MPLPSFDRAELIGYAGAAIVAVGILLVIALIPYGCAKSLEDRATPADEDLVGGPAREAIWSLFPPEARTPREIRTPGTTDGFFHHSDPGTITATIEVDTSLDETRRQIIDNAVRGGWTVASLTCGPTRVDFTATLNLHTPIHDIQLHVQGLSLSPDATQVSVGAELRRLDPDWDEAPTVEVPSHAQHGNCTTP